MMRGDAIRVWGTSVVVVLLIFILGSIPSCSRKASVPGDGSTASTPDSLLGGCVQLKVTIGDGFEVDGQPVSDEELPDMLFRAYGARNREIAIDVRCGEGVTMAAVAQLQDAMLSRGLRRIQYVSPAGDLLPYVLPTSEMSDLLASLPPEETTRVRIATGALSHDGRDVQKEALGKRIGERLEENPGVVVVVEAEADVAYVDFVAIFGEVVASGAERVAVEIPLGVEI